MKFCLKAILFDVDGTIIDWKPNSSFIKKMITHPTVFLNILSDVQNMERKRGQYVVPDQSSQQREQNECFIIDRNQITTQIRSVIQRGFDDNLQMGIVSDNRSIEKLKKLQLLSYFSVLINCRESGSLKPSPEGLIRACTQMGVSPNQVLYIGDRTRVDDRACFEIGMQFLPMEYIHKLEWTTTM